MTDTHPGPPAARAPPRAMALIDNRPTTEQLRSKLSGLSAKDLAKVDDGLLAMLLGVSIADVQKKARTAFNARTRLENRDGNGTSFLSLWRWPSIRILDVRVETPILGYIRVYQPDEIKNYAYQAQIQIFTYKMVADTITGNHLDLASSGTIFPPIPQSVHVTYAYGFGQYDPELDQTTFDGGQTFEAGDTRDDDHADQLARLQMAALNDAAASYLAQVAGLGVGLLSAVSFDGLSKTLNPQAYGAQVQALVEQRDRLLARASRPYFATVGITGA